MRVFEYPFTDNDTEYRLIKELLLEIQRHPDIDNNRDPGRMDWWRHNYHAEDAEFFSAFW